MNFAARHHLKVALRFFLALTLIQSFLAPYAVPTTTPSQTGMGQLNNLLQAMTGIPMVPETADRLIEDGNRAEDFLSKNPKLAATTLGKQVKDVATKVKNYSKMANDFKECQDKRNLKDRILAIAKTMSPKDTSCTCDRKGEDYSKVEGAIRYSDLQRQLSKNALLGAVDKYFEVKHKYDDGNTSDLIDKICGKGCTPQDRALLQKRYEYDNSLAKPAKLDVEHQFYMLNNKLAEANKPLDAISVDPNPFKKTESINSVSNQQHYKEYEQKYLEAVGSESGFLLATNTMQDYFGHFRTFDHDLNLGINRDFDPHHVSGNGNHNENIEYGPKVIMKQAVKEAIETIASEAQDIAKMNEKKLADEGGKVDGTVSRNMNKSEKDLMDLIESNPVAVAQTLLNNPAATKDVCDILKKIDERNASRAHWHKVAMISIGVTAGLLAVTGLGVGAAVWLLGLAVVPASVVTAGVIVAGGSFIVSGAGLAEAEHHREQAWAEYEVLRQSFVAGTSYNSDETKLVSFKEQSAALNAYYDAKNETYMAGAGFAADALGLGIAVKVRQMANLARAARLAKEAEELKATTEALKDINTVAQEGELNETIQRVRSPAAAGEEKAKGLFQSLSKLNEKVRLRLLRQMSKLSNKSLKELADVAIKEAMKCG